VNSLRLNIRLGLPWVYVDDDWKQLKPTATDMLICTTSHGKSIKITQLTAVSNSCIITACNYARREPKQPSTG